MVYTGKSSDLEILQAGQIYNIVKLGFKIDWKDIPAHILEIVLQIEETVQEKMRREMKK